MGLYDFDQNSEKQNDSDITDATLENVTSDCEEKIEESVSEGMDSLPSGTDELPTISETVKDNEEDEEDNKKNIVKKRRFKKTRKRIIKEIISFVAIILVAFIVAIFINIYVIRTSNVSGVSMEPTLHSGTSVLISRIPYMFSEPERGDIIVFDSSLKERTFFKDIKESLSDNVITGLFTKDSPSADMEKFFIKRVVGIAGDVISVKDLVMYINGKPLTAKDYSIYADINAYRSCEDKTWTVKEGYVFVLGDNRNNSKDSRIIGLVPIDCIMGKVVKE